MPLFSVLKEKRNKQIEHQKVYDELIIAIETDNTAALQQLIQQGGLPSSYYTAELLQNSVSKKNSDALALLLEHYKPQGNVLQSLTRFAYRMEDMNSAQLLWKNAVGIQNIDIRNFYEEIVEGCKKPSRVRDKNMDHYPITPWIQLIQSRGITLTPLQMSLFMREAISQDFPEIIPALIAGCSPSEEPSRFDSVITTALEMNNMRALAILKEHITLPREAEERLEEFKARHS